MGDLSKNFSRHEFACRCGCGFDTVDTKTLEVLQDLRDYFNVSVTPTSGCRCDAYNRKVGGASKSKHKEGRATDFQMALVRPKEAADYLEKKYPGKYGIGRYSTFTHVDTRSGGAARWGRN